MWGWRKESDLKVALNLGGYWPLQEEGSSYSTTRKDRLDIARLLINAGSDIDLMTFPALFDWAIMWDNETVLSVVGNHDNLHWDVSQIGLGPCIVLNHPEGCYDDLSVSQFWFENFIELCKRLKINLSFTQPNGLTLLHQLIEEPFYEQISHLKCFLCLLISNGVDPCAVCEGYLTPILVAFFRNKLALWFTVLRQSGISVEAVAAHALRLMTGSNMQDIMLKITLGRRSYAEDFPVFSYWKWLADQGNWRAMSKDPKQLRAALIEAFECQGCYLNESGDRGNMVTYKASSSVDFKPSTVYDPERARLDIRRRTGAQENSQ